MFDMSLIVAFVAAFLVITFTVYIFFIPLNWIKSLEDFELDTKKKSRAKRRKKFASEKIPPPFPNGWFAIAESKEIKSGAATSISCLGEDFVVYRSNESEEIFILDAFCPHMGANLGVGGIVRGDCIECPFHQWKFRGSDGVCDNIPYSKSINEIEKSAKLKKWKSREANGLVFVWYHAEHDNPWELPIVREIEDGSWAYHGRNEFMVQCHIQDIPENGADVAHLMSVHGPSIIAGSDIRFTRSSWLAFGNHIWNAKWNVDDENKHMAKLTLTHLVKILKFELIKIVANVKQIGPGYVILYLESSFGPMVVLQTLTPVEPFVQKLCHYFYGPRYLAWFVKFTVIGETINVARDVMIWNNKKFSSNPLLPKEDKLIKQFRIWYSQFYSENSKTFDMATADLSW